MNIDKVRELKADLDFKLSQLVVEFENETGLEISSLGLKREVLEDEPIISVNAFVIL